MGNITRTIRRQKVRHMIETGKKTLPNTSRALHAFWYLDLKKRDPRRFDDIAYLRKVGFIKNAR